MLTLCHKLLPIPALIQSYNRLQLSSITERILDRHLAQLLLVALLIYSLE